MSLQTFGERLKQQRLQIQISLSNISAATRINIKFLDAIEQGQFSVLPQPYIRAFLREYAQAIDLKPDDVVQQYMDEVQKGKPQREEVPAAPVVTPPTPVNVKSKELVQAAGISNRHLVFLGFIVGAVIIVLYVTNTGPGTTESKTVTEVPFDRVVQESEATLAKHEQAQPPSIPNIAAAESDSLTLEMTSTDSVWISLLIDKNKAEEYLFPPNWKRSWRAKDEFLVTMGNAGGAAFRLNGVELGTLGKRGSVVRDVPIRESMLQKQ